MFSFRGAAGEPLQLTSQFRAYLQRARLLFLSGYHLIRKRQGALALWAAWEIKKKGGLVALDPSPSVGQVPEEILREIFACTDILLPKERELRRC